MRIAVLASGNGSNFEAIAAAFKDHETVKIAMVFSDKPDAYVHQRADKWEIPSFSLQPKDFPSKDAYEWALLELLESKKIDFVVLAGYMRIIGPAILEAYPQKIINIHPSLLPAFPGVHGIKDAFEYGVKVTGVTVHFIDSGVDTGPIIAQKAVEVSTEDTLETLEEKIHRVEHQLYPQVLANLFNEGRND